MEAMTQATGCTPDVIVLLQAEAIVQVSAGFPNVASWEARLDAASILRSPTSVASRLQYVCKVVKGLAELSQEGPDSRPSIQ